MLNSQDSCWHHFPFSSRTSLGAIVPPFEVSVKPGLAQLAPSLLIWISVATGASRLNALKELGHESFTHASSKPYK
jgi:hypothetical protein